MTSSNIQKLHVADLRVGMYVCELDREWLETPFLMQGFLLDEEADIGVVAQYCEHVYIDHHLKAKPRISAGGKPNVTFAPINQLIYEAPVEEEHQKVNKTFSRARSQTRDLLDDTRLGGAINSEAVKSTVNDCVQSVLRNPDALMWMAKIREENEYTAEHSLNVCILAVAFGRHMGMNEEQLQLLGLCGLLHDIGKMRVPNELLEKPGRLTDKEMKMMKAHTVHGRNLLLSTTNIYAGAIDVAYSHHERIDGTGYPRKLPGAGISKFSRIISIVDAYDAMTADRCYSPAKSTTEALKIIYSQRGKQFDEELAIQFIKTIGLFPVGSIVELYSGEVGIVIETNQKWRHLPRVILLLDDKHEPREKQIIIDLSYIESGDLPRTYLVKHVWPDGKYGLYLRDQKLKDCNLKSGSLRG
ncbi:MAG: putative nucleotidyltransferase with HDIG domain [Lentisphaeria bacterium]